MACAHMLSTARKYALDAPPSHIAPPTFTMCCCSCAHYIARSLCCSECSTLQPQKGHTSLNDNSIKELCMRNAPTTTILGCVLCHSMHAIIFNAAAAANAPSPQSIWFVRASHAIGACAFVPASQQPAPQNNPQETKKAFIPMP